ncbi:hypothetical protein KP509_16G000800 [Ceratopteris richardii]|uniref:Uncharacterized protein n=1 Tax=Ceratopteris richardii TaxID=49495 RepID=A0A8T2T0A8_CERRI|nr:hypothetical protein KP509_16G000800 [Ceratopteris richardii]
MKYLLLGQDIVMLESLVCDATTIHILESMSKHTAWNKALATIGGVASSALMMPCGIDGLLSISLEIMSIWGLSTNVHVWCASLGPHIDDPYISEGVTNVSNSLPFMQGS